jgi:hypothetical protein
MGRNIKIDLRKIGCKPWIGVGVLMMGFNGRVFINLLTKLYVSQRQGNLSPAKQGKNFSWA